MSVHSHTPTRLVRTWRSPGRSSRKVATRDLDLEDARQQYPEQLLRDSGPLGLLPTHGIAIMFRTSGADVPDLRIEEGFPPWVRPSRRRLLLVPRRPSKRSAKEGFQSAARARRNASSTRSPTSQSCEASRPLRSQETSGGRRGTASQSQPAGPASTGTGRAGAFSVGCGTGVGASAKHDANAAPKSQKTRNSDAKGSGSSCLARC